APRARGGAGVATDRRGLTAADADESDERVLASRSLAELPAVAAQVERDPVGTLALYHAAKRLVGRLDLGDTLDAVTDAVLEIVPRATHLAVLRRAHGDEERFTVLRPPQPHRRPA